MAVVESTFNQEVLLPVFSTPLHFRDKYFSFTPLYWNTQQHTDDDRIHYALCLV